MKSLPTQARAVLKRQTLISAAVEEFSKFGFEVATAKSIAAIAGVATGTFYQYFENKNDILRVIAGDRFADLQTRVLALELNVGSGENSTQLIEHFETTLWFVYEFHAQDPELHQVLEQRRNVDPELRELMRAGEVVLKARVLQFVNAMNTPHAEVVAANLFSMAEGIVHRLVFDTHNNDPRKVIRVGAEMLASYFTN